MIGLVVEEVSIPERVLEALKQLKQSAVSSIILVSIPERVLEALKLTHRDPS